MKENYIRFDWAVKRLLRLEANFVILEGFLSVLLKDIIKISCLLEGKKNKHNENKLSSRLHLLAYNHRNERILIELQNTYEFHYYYQMLCGRPNTICEYINGNEIEPVHKVYSINIIYFDLGLGSDYVYHGKTDFKGMHTGEHLGLTIPQQYALGRLYADNTLTEYYVLRADKFNQQALTPLDEWIAYIKTSDIPAVTTTPGLNEARELFRKNLLPIEEKKRYEKYRMDIRDQNEAYKVKVEKLEQEKADRLSEGITKGLAEGLEKGKKEEKLIIARKAKAKGMSVEDIADLTGLTMDEIKALN